MTKSTHEERGGNPSGVDLEGLYVCPECGGLHKEKPSDRRPYPGWPGHPASDGENHVETPARLCDACGRVVLAGVPQHQAAFCAGCTSELEELNSLVPQPVIPVPTGLRAVPKDRLAEALKKIAEHRRIQVSGLLEDTGVDEGKGLALTEYLERIEEFDSELRSRESAVTELACSFVDKLISKPEESEELRLAIEERARTEVIDLPAARILDALDEGPCAVTRLARERAQVALSDLLPVVEYLGRDFPAFMESAPTFRALVDAIEARIDLVWGDAELPPMPSVPDGFTVTVNDGVDGVPPDYVPKRCPRMAKFLFQDEVSNAPGFTWVEQYFLSRNQKRTHWILWDDYEDIDTGRRRRAAMAWCSAGGLDETDAAMILVRALWEVCRDCWYRDEPHFISATGLLSEDELNAVAARVWPEWHARQAEGWD